MKDKSISKASIQADIEEFEKNGKLNKSKLTLDWMDNYVAKYHPDDIEQYVKDCSKFSKKDKKDKDGKKVGEVKDIQAVRNYVINKYFIDYTDEAIEKRKQEKKEAREAIKEEKKRIAKLSLEEQLAIKLKKLAEEE